MSKAVNFNFLRWRWTNKQNRQQNTENKMDSHTVLSKITLKSQLKTWKTLSLVRQSISQNTGFSTVWNGLQNMQHMTYIQFIHSLHRCCLSGRGLYGRNISLSWGNRSSNSPSPPLVSSKCDISSSLAYVIYFVWSQNVPILGLFFGELDTNIVVSSFIAFARFSITSLTHSTVSMSASTNSPAPTVAKRLNDWQEGSLALFIALWSQCVQMWRQMRETPSLIQRVWQREKENKHVSLFIEQLINLLVITTGP